VTGIGLACVLVLLAAVLAWLLADPAVWRRRLRPWPARAANAREFALACEAAAAEGGSHLSVRPWDWGLRDVVLVEIARSRGWEWRPHTDGLARRSAMDFVPAEQVS